MITEETVLILGAGASRPYSFPLGSQLVRVMCDRLKPGTNSAYKAPLIELGHTEMDLERFGDRLRKSSRSSIDAFLQHNPSLYELGKRIIARTLLPKEHEDALYSKAATTDGSWYAYLFDCLNADFDDFSENKLSVITFNYDRSLEHFLYTALKHAYEGVDNDKICNALKSIPFVHIHGELGSHPYQGESEPRPYVPTEDAKMIDFAARRIRIVHEEIRDSHVIGRVAKLLSAAKRVCFLGFGYDPINLRLLELSNAAQSQLWGTSYGLTEAERYETAYTIKELTEGNNTLRLYNTNNDILEYLRATNVLLPRYQDTVPTHERIRA